MALKDVQNVNPQLFTRQNLREITVQEEDDSVEDVIDEREIFGKYSPCFNWIYLDSNQLFYRLVAGHKWSRTSNVIGGT